MNDYRLGKRPARLNAVALKLKTYLDPDVLPKIPANVGHDALMSSWPMLANDRVGCCVVAGGGHETQLWNAEAARSVSFTDSATLSDYSALTGYDPTLTDPVTGENPTDLGTDVQQAATYRQKTGLVDAAGVRHKIGAYLAVTPGDPDELAAAIYIFGCVGVGLRFPDFAMAQFTAGKPWSMQGQYGAPRINGGHYVPAVARRNGVFDVVTWGRIQHMEVPFLRQFCDEVIVYLSREFLTATTSPEGFDLQQLQADLRAFIR